MCSHIAFETISKDDGSRSSIRSKMFYIKTTFSFRSYLLMLVCILISSSTATSSLWNRVFAVKAAIHDQDDNVSSSSTNIQNTVQAHGTNIPQKNDDRLTVESQDVTGGIADLTLTEDRYLSEDVRESFHEIDDTEKSLQNILPSLLDVVQLIPDSSNDTILDLELVKGNASAFDDITNTSCISHIHDKDESDDEELDVMVFDTASKRLPNGERRSQFFERISIMSSALMRREIDASILPTMRLQQLKSKLMQLSPLQQRDGESIQMSEEELKAVTPQSDLSLPGRYFHVVTTAALPWFTGTAVNPLLRAAYLHRRTKEINAHYERQYENVHYHQEKRSFVTLVVPWLELPEDQSELYNRVFESTADQEGYIRSWLRSDARLPDVADELEILFYPARYHSGLRSIFAMGDIMDVIPTANRDVCILEEPEHCNWFRAPGQGWTKQFNFVVGIVHTNYKEYALSHYSGLFTAPAIQVISSALVRAYCHKVIKLSSALQSYASEKETTSNVHGVRSEFIETGIAASGISKDMLTNETDNIASSKIETQIYFIGKLLWAKGLDLLLELEDYYKDCTGSYFAVDIYGSGPDEKAIMRAFHGYNTYSSRDNVIDNRNVTRRDFNGSSFNIHIMGTSFSLDGKMFSQKDEEIAGQQNTELLPSFERIQEKAKEKLAKLKETISAVEFPQFPQSFSEFRRLPIPAAFHGRVDHAVLKDHKIFVNPSVSEVLCTTTAEALAMGKFVVIPDHPSNKFFLRFPNCLAYRNKFEFVANLRWAMTYDPEPLTPEQSRAFSWEAATDRLIEASAVTQREALARERLGRHKLDERIAWFHNELGKGQTGDMLRKLCGAGPVSHQVEYQNSIALKHANGDLTTDDEEDESVSNKFRRSSFVAALRAALADLTMMMQ